MQIRRVNRSNHEAQKAYDFMSHFYDRLASPSEFRFVQEGIELLTIDSGGPILEIGCGTGKALEEIFYRADKQAQLYGLDLSRGMLHVTVTRLRKSGMEKFTYLLQGDGKSLPYASSRFFAIFISFTLELFDTAEIPLVVAECRRVLMPGGRLVVVAMHKAGHDRWIVRLYEWLHERFPNYLDCRPIEVANLLRGSGFSIVRQTIQNMWGIPVTIVLARKHENP